MRESAVAAGVFCTLCFPTALGAQDFGRAWIDEVSQRLEDDAVPLEPAPVGLKIDAGELVYWDSNVFLTEKKRRSDTVFVTYGRARMEYAEPMFDVEADAMVNYSAYARLEDASDHEERFFGRGRLQHPAFAGELAAILRRESDPFTDPEVAERVERAMAGLYPRAPLPLGMVFPVEAGAETQIVRFRDEDFKALDNQTGRAALGLAAAMAPGFDVAAQGGYVAIDYEEEPGSPPDARGWFARLGARGDLTSSLRLDAWAGAAAIKADRSPATGEAEGHATGDFDVHLRWEASERLAFLADYTRRFGFSSGGSPFQVTDRLAARGEYELFEGVMARLRGQYDRVKGAWGEERRLCSVSAGLEWKVQQFVALTAGATVRAGERDPKPASGGEFVDVILSVGAAVCF